MTPAQCRAARALLDLTQTQLAEAAGFGLSTVVDFERLRREVSADAIAAIRSALEAAGIEFTNGGEPGVKFRKRESPEAATQRRGNTFQMNPRDQYSDAFGGHKGLDNGKHGGGPAIMKRDRRRRRVHYGDHAG